MPCIAAIAGYNFFQNKQIPIQFPNAYFVTTGSLYCGIFRVCSLYSNLSLHCGHVHLYDMSVSNPLVTPIHNGTTCVDMVNFFCRISACVRNPGRDMRVLFFNLFRRLNMLFERLNILFAQLIILFEQHN